MTLWYSALHDKSPLGWLLNFIIAISLTVLIGYSSAAGSFGRDSNTNLTLNDTRLKAELIVGGLDFPTAMRFLGPNDILVLEKDNGTIRRITEGTLLKEPLLGLNVSGVGENGLTGIAVANNEQKAIGNSTRIFLYVTETLNGDTMDPHAFSRNRLYRYDFVNDQFTNRKLLLDLPTGNNIHNGGKIVIGFDQNVYVSIGDTGRYGANLRKTQNHGEGLEPDGTGGILRITQDGKPVTENATKILGSEYPLNLYYAYGIRNSFGMDFDPVTGRLWITDNGPSFGDELNLVKPGFNSGWNKVQGFWKNEAGEKGELDLNPQYLVDFDGKGEYSNPEFVWDFPVGLTALKFF